MTWPGGDLCPGGCGSRDPLQRRMVAHDPGGRLRAAGAAIPIVRCRDPWHDRSPDPESTTGGAPAAPPLEASRIEPPTLVVWVVYRNPRDYPGRYVLRRWWIDGTGLLRAELEPRWTATNLAEVRKQIPEGRVRLDPDPNDAAAICEIWL